MPNMLTLKTLHSLEKVFPLTEPQGTESAKTVLSGETAHFQLAVYNPADNFQHVFGYTLKIESDFGDKLRVREVLCVPADNLPPQVDDYSYGVDKGMYPELLRPVDTGYLIFALQKWQSLWFTVDTDNVAPGKHEIRLTIFDKEGQNVGEAQYALTVIPEKIADSDFYFTTWMHYDAIEAKHNVELFGDAFYEVFAGYLDAFLRSGNTLLYTPLFTPPLDTYVGGERRTAQLIGVRFEDGAYTFDFTKLDRFLDFAEAHGIRYFEMSHLFTQWGGKACPKIIASTPEGEKRIFGWETSSLCPEYAAFLTAFLPQLCRFLTEKGLAKRVFFHLTDEPHEDHLETYTKLYHLVKGLIGDFPTLDALSDYSFYERGVVDIPVPSIKAYEREFRSRKPENVFVYYCGANNAYYTGRMFDMPLQRTRVLGFGLYEAGVDGFLHWGFNFYNTFFSLRELDPYFETAGGRGFYSGDSFIVYPTKGGCLMSNRAEALGEAMYDYRALKTLEKYIGREKVLDFLHKEGVLDFYTYPRSAKAHIAIREKINAMIAAHCGK